MWHKVSLVLWQAQTGCLLKPPPRPCAFLATHTHTHTHTHIHTHTHTHTRTHTHSQEDNEVDQAPEQVGKDGQAEPRPLLPDLGVLNVCHDCVAPLLDLKANHNTLWQLQQGTRKEKRKEGGGGGMR